MMSVVMCPKRCGCESGFFFSRMLDFCVTVAFVTFEWVLCISLCNMYVVEITVYCQATIERLLVKRSHLYGPSDASCTRVVMYRYPELHRAWQRMKPIEKADTYRYAVLHHYGGYYADLDVTCARPIDLWTKQNFQYDNVDFIVGFEVSIHKIAGSIVDFEVRTHSNLVAMLALR